MEIESQLVVNVVEERPREFPGNSPTVPVLSWWLIGSSGGAVPLHRFSLWLLNDDDQ